MRHVTSHDACRSDLQLVKVTLCQLRLIGSENLIQLLRRFLLNVFAGFLLRICFQIDFPQVLVQFCERHLDRGFHCVDINGRKLYTCCTSCHRKLILKHELHKLCQHAVLCTENVLEAAAGHAGLLDDFRHSCLFVPLLQEEFYAYLQDAFLCWFA